MKITSIESPNFPLIFFLAILTGLIWAVTDDPQAIQKILYPNEDFSKESTAPSSTLSPKTKPQEKKISQEIKLTKDFAEGIFLGVENKLAKGDFVSAKEELSKCPAGNIPPELAEKYQELAKRVSLYNDLISELVTSPPHVIPALYKISLKNKNIVYAQLLEESNSSILYEALSGIRSKISKSDVASFLPLPPGTAKEIREKEYKKRFDKILTKRNTALEYCKLAEFCIKEGLNEHLAELVPRIYSLDPNVIANVRKEKALGIYDVTLFYLSTGDKEKSSQLGQILKDKYPETNEAVEIEKDIAPPLEILPPIPPPPVSPTEDITKKIAEFIATGDKYLSEAMQHLKNSAPGSDLEKIDKELHTALELLAKTIDAYQKAQALKYSEELEKKISDINYTRYWTRKRTLIPKRQKDWH